MKKKSWLATLSQDDAAVIAEKWMGSKERRAVTNRAVKKMKETVFQ